MAPLTKMMLFASLSVGFSFAARADQPAENLLMLSLESTLSRGETLHSGSDEGNSLTLTGLGESNSGFGSDWPVPALFAQSPEPGVLVQRGRDNSMVLNVVGQGNVFAVMQAGQGHSLLGAVSGQSNAVAVTQIGQGQRAQFQQHGARNALAISQATW